MKWNGREADASEAETGRVERETGTEAVMEQESGIEAVMERESGTEAAVECSVDSTPEFRLSAGWLPSPLGHILTAALSPSLFSISIAYYSYVYVCSVTV